MQKEKIVILPLDERPCNYNFPSMLTKDNADFNIIMPSRNILGEKKKAANFYKLQEFLLTECKNADTLILSVDMLLYGGIVPSRLHNLKTEELNCHLQLIKQLRQQNEKLKIYAFSLIMRCPQYSSDDEEPDYYGECGREIFLLGETLDKQAKEKASKEELDKIPELRKKTDGALDDYFSRRKTNLSMNLKVIDMLSDGNIDFLIIPQDDSSVYGYIAIDQQQVREYVVKTRNQLKCLIYPGADEVELTLLARCVTDKKGRLNVNIKYSSTFGAGVIPLYEDRPVGETVKFQLMAAGCVICDESSADCTLYLNTPSANMKHANISGVFREYQIERTLPEFVDNILYKISCGKLAAVADIAYVNGGDVELVSMLEDAKVLDKLAAYAGWNTSSNTLGTAICQTVICANYGFTETHKKFLAQRFYEDVGYCAYARKKVCDDYLPKMNLNYFNAGAVDGEVAKIVKQEIETFISELLPSVTKYKIKKVTMPWKRMFETEIIV